MQRIAKAYDAVINGLVMCAGGAISVAFRLIVSDVLMRLVQLSPPAFTITIVEYILLYFTMFSAPWLVRVKGDVFVDALTQLMPGKVQTVLAKFVYLASICSALTFA